MRIWKSGIVATAVLVFSSMSFGQAAAEGALTHALSSGMGSSIGTSLGKATNQLSGKVGQQVSNVTTRANVPSARRPQQRTTPVSSTPSGGAPAGSLIASIQGGETRDARCAPQTIQASQAAAKDGEASKKLVENQAAHSGEPASHCSPTESRTDDHPSVVTLPSPK